jgi:hypothetical protein
MRWGSGHGNLAFPVNRVSYRLLDSYPELLSAAQACRRRQRDYGSWALPEPMERRERRNQTIKSGIWSPSTDDFIAVERNSRKKGSKKPTLVVDSVEAFIHLILDQPVGSIKRINILTHGNENWIAFSGEIEEGNVSFNEVLDISTLRGMLLHGIEYRGMHVGWEQVESRFGRNAEIVVYACKAAVGRRRRCGEVRRQRAASSR